MQIQLNNRYRVIRTLGGGGFGETFLAEDTQMPSNRRCVIKQLRPIQNNPQIYQLVQERFQREAAILEELGGTTDQIPTLYAYFQTDGQFYLVQEWVEGDTLTAKIQQQGFLSESSVREILLNLLPILEYVHNKRIIHRDIKPDNIILRHRDGKPVLIDFGAVRESMGTVMNSQGLPTKSIVIGTPGFMPSEQAAGRPVYSSDLYSLGLTAIYLLTGKQPHELELDSPTGEIIWQRHALSVSPTLAGVLDRAITYHPRERFVTAREMLEALQFKSVSPTVPYNQPPAVNVQPPATLQNIVAVSPGSASHQPDNQSSGQRGMLFGALIAGGLIGASIIIGFALNKTPQPVAESTPSIEASTTREEQQEVRQSVQSQLQPFPSISSETSSSSLPPTTQQQQEIDKPSPSPGRPLSLGWIRLGAVNNTFGTATIGEPLIKTTQSVTIEPSYIPKIGAQVRVINGVNLRINRPQKPDYQLPQQKGVVVVGQQLVIVNLDYFTDPNSTSPYTAVWAEVGLQN